MLPILNLKLHAKLLVPRVRLTLVPFVSLIHCLFFTGCTAKGDTRVNWFYPIEARFIRIVPTARPPANHLNCIRMELFGCSPKGLSVHDNFFRNAEYRITDSHNKNITFYGTASGSDTVKITIAASRENPTISYKNLDQFSFSRIDAFMLHSNGTFVQQNTITKIASPVLQIPTSAIVVFEPTTRDYYAFHIETHGRV